MIKRIKWVLFAVLLIVAILFGTITASCAATYTYDDYINSTTSHWFSNCASGETGASGQTAGDQTGNEYKLSKWAATLGNGNPWIAVFRYPNQNVALKIAQLGIDAAKNDHIGYDWGYPDRESYWNELKEVNYNPSAITKNCEADCSSAVCTNVRAAGYIFGINKLKNISMANTATLTNALLGAGFEKLTESKYLTRKEYLMPGDILLASGHTLINLTRGAYAIPTKVDFDVNAMLDDVLMTNLGNCGTFDLYIDGTLVAQNAKDFNGSYYPGTKYKITNIQTNAGYTFNGVGKQYWGNYVSGPLEGEILSHTTKVCLSFSTGTPQIPYMDFDVNAMLDGTLMTSLWPCGNMDVYINGQLMSQGVTDFNGSYPVGTPYAVTNVQTNPGYIFNGVGKQYWGNYVSGPLEGEIANHTTKVCLSFSTDPAYITSVNISGSNQVIAGETIQLSATVLPSTANNSQITWYSEYPQFVDVDQNGVVTGIMSGGSSIHAVAQNGVEDIFYVECQTNIINLQVTVNGVELGQSYNENSYEILSVGEPVQVDYHYETTNGYDPYNFSLFITDCVDHDGYQELNYNASTGSFTWNTSGAFMIYCSLGGVTMDYPNVVVFMGSDVIRLPEGLITIEEEAFSDIPWSVIIIPDSVRNIGSGAFTFNTISSVIMMDCSISRNIAADAFPLIFALADTGANNSQPDYLDEYSVHYMTRK